MQYYVCIHLWATKDEILALLTVVTLDEFGFKAESLHMTDGALEASSMMQWTVEIQLQHNFRMWAFLFTFPHFHCAWDKNALNDPESMQNGQIFHWHA